MDAILDPSLRSKIVDLVVKQLMALLLARVPFLSFGPLSWIASHFVKFGVSYLLKKAILRINEQWIESDRRELAEKFDKLLKEYDSAPNEEKKDEVEKELVDKARDIITLFNKPRL